MLPSLWIIEFGTGPPAFDTIPIIWNSFVANTEKVHESSSLFKARVKTLTPWFWLWVKLDLQTLNELPVEQFLIWDLMGSGFSNGLKA